MRDDARLVPARLGSARRKHRFVYCCVIAGACFDVTVLAWRKYASQRFCKIHTIFLHLPRYEDQEITPCRLETLPDSNRNNFGAEIMAAPLFQVLRLARFRNLLFNFVIRLHTLLHYRSYENVPLLRLAITFTLLTVNIQNIVTFQRIVRQWLDKHPVIHARNNRTGFCNPFLGNGLVNTSA
jgi:hypothetical protein